MLRRELGTAAPQLLTTIGGAVMLRLGPARVDAAEFLRRMAGRNGRGSGRDSGGAAGPA